MTAGEPVARPDAGERAGEHERFMLRQMILVRRFEERCIELYSAGEIHGFLHVGIGEEAAAVGVISNLAPEDAIVGTYREHGHALVRGIDPGRIMAEMFGRVEGVSGGRGGSMHLFDEQARFFGGNAIVAGGLPIAVGLALADRMQGRARCTACFFGDGAVAEGEFHEAMNLAALWDLPVLFCCENNRYAMGTALDRSESQTDLALKAAAYAMASWSVDAMDVDEVDRAASAAIESVRSGHGPHFLELKTYRFRAHSMYDPERYRDKAEVERWRARDPITTATERCRASGAIDDDDLAEIEAEIRSVIDAAVAFAAAGTLEPVADLTRFVHSEPVR